VVPYPRGITVVMVRDTLKALGDFAYYHRKRVAPKVLAITGSNGKTMTKEMVAAILEQATLRGKSLRGKVLSTAGNYNNLVGLPLTLLRLQGKEKIAVLEGMKTVLSQWVEECSGDGPLTECPILDALNTGEGEGGHD